MRLAIVGCGFIGRKRADAAKRHRICVVADSDRAQCETLAAATGARPVLDWNEAIMADVDAVVVSTPHDLLAPVALAAIQNGKHVLVEKPAARTPSEFAKVVEAARAARRVVKIGYNHRFHPAILEAHRLITSGELGPLMFLRARYGHGGRLGYEKEWRATREISGGGELIDQGTHLIDLAHWLLGPLRLEYACLPTLFWDMEVDDNCFLALRGARGEMAWLHASWTEWKNMFSLEIYGRTGKLAIDGLGGSYGPERLVHFRMSQQMGPPETTMQKYSGPDTSWEREFEAFEAALEGKAVVSASMEDALSVLEIVHSSYSRATK